MRSWRSKHIRLIAGAAAIILIVIFYVRATSNDGLGYELLPVSANMPIMAFGENVLCYDGQRLLCVSAKGQNLWEYEIGDSGAEFDASSQDIVAWNGGQIHVLGRDGVVAYSANLDGDIVMARAGSKYTAVELALSSGSEVRVLDRQGEIVDTLSFDEMLVDFGFFDQDDKLWTLSVDISGASPDCYIGTYQPGTREMGKVLETAQLVYGVFYNRSEMLLLGTRYLNSSDSYGKIDDTKKKLVYGWELAAKYIGGNGVTLVLAHPDELAASSISSVRVISGVNDKSFRFPVGVLGVLAGSAKIYGITKTALVTCDYTGATRESRALPFAVDGVLAYLEKDRAVVSSNGSVYVLSLN